MHFLSSGSIRSDVSTKHLPRKGETSCCNRLFGCFNFVGCRHPACPGQESNGRGLFPGILHIAEALMQCQQLPATKELSHNQYGLFRPKCAHIPVNRRASSHRKKCLNSTLTPPAIYIASEAPKFHPPKPMNARILSFICTLASIGLAFSGAHGHSGGTDAQGGHHDRKNGGYHFHHGKPAHQHPNGVCPYGQPAKSAPATTPKPQQGISK